MQQQHGPGSGEFDSVIGQTVNYTMVSSHSLSALISLINRERPVRIPLLHLETRYSSSKALLPPTLCSQLDVKKASALRMQLSCSTLLIKLKINIIYWKLCTCTILLYLTLSVHYITLCHIILYYIICPLVCVNVDWLHHPTGPWLG